MHKYQSHKTVSAAKIIGVKPNTTQVFCFQLDGDEEAVCDLSWVKKHSNDEGAEILIGGYFVLYDDGYSSWSPAKAFEEGYTLKQPSSGKSKIAGYRELSEGEISLMNMVKAHGVDLGHLVQQMRDNQAKDERIAELESDAKEYRKMNAAKAERIAELEARVNNYDEKSLSLSRLLVEQNFDAVLAVVTEITLMTQTQQKDAQ